MRKEGCWSFVFFFVSGNAASEGIPPAAVLKAVFALWSAGLSLSPVLMGVRDPWGL